MNKILDLINKYKIQIIVIAIVLLLIPIIKITIDNINKNYKLERTYNSKQRFIKSYGEITKTS